MKQNIYLHGSFFSPHLVVFAHQKKEAVLRCTCVCSFCEYFLDLTSRPYLIFNYQQLFILLSVCLIKQNYLTIAESTSPFQTELKFRAVWPHLYLSRWSPSRDRAAFYNGERTNPSNSTPVFPRWSQVTFPETSYLIEAQLKEFHIHIHFIIFQEKEI